MSLWKYSESYRLVLCRTRDDGITRRGPYPFFIPETMIGRKPHILPLLSAFLTGFKWKELGFLKNLPCLAGCSLSSPSQDPARRGSPSAVASSPWCGAEEDKSFSQLDSFVGEEPVLLCMGLGPCRVSELCWTRSAPATINRDTPPQGNFHLRKGICPYSSTNVYVCIFQ